MTTPPSTTQPYTIMLRHTSTEGIAKANTPLGQHAAAYFNRGNAKVNHSAAFDDYDTTMPTTTPNTPMQKTLGQRAIKDVTLLYKSGFTSPRPPQAGKCQIQIRSILVCHQQL